MLSIIILIALSPISWASVTRRSGNHPYGNYDFPAEAYAPPGNGKQADSVDKILAYSEEGLGPEIVPESVPMGPGPVISEKHVVEMGPGLETRRKSAKVTSGPVVPPPLPMEPGPVVASNDVPMEPGPVIPENRVVEMGPGDDEAEFAPGPVIPHHHHHHPSMGPGPVILPHDVPVEPGPVMPHEHILPMEPGPVIPPRHPSMGPGPAALPVPFLEGPGPVITPYSPPMEFGPAMPYEGGSEMGPGPMIPHPIPEGPGPVIPPQPIQHGPGPVILPQPIQHGPGP
ncbi:hypothetical protein ANCDUO_21194, partial [Ancylostoma duodenale]